MCCVCEGAMLADAGFGLPGTSGVPPPPRGSGDSPFCNPRLCLLGFIGVNYHCGWGGVGRSLAPAPGPGRIMRVRAKFGDLEGGSWEVGGHGVG